MKKLLLVFTLPFLFMGCMENSPETNPSAQKEAPSGPNLAEVLSQREDVYTFLRAVRLLEAESILEGDNPFTLFIPQDEAFNQIPTEAREELFLPENKKRLDALIGYHVARGKGKSSDLFDGAVIETIIQDNGILVNMDEEGKLILNKGAQVLEADIEASNGMIFIIDSVLIPNILAQNEQEEPSQTSERSEDPVSDDPETSEEDSSAQEFSLPSVAQENGFELFVQLLDAADLLEMVANAESLTLLAPTDQAFMQMDPTLIQALVSGDNPEFLTEILGHHIISAPLTGDDLLEEKQIEALTGHVWDLKLDEEGIPHLGETYFQGVDLGDDRQVIHVIDQVLLPDGLEIPYANPSTEEEVSSPENAEESPLEEIEMSEEEEIIEEQAEIAPEDFSQEQGEDDLSQE